MAVYKQVVALFPDNLDCGLQLASAQIANSALPDALSTLNALRRLPQPTGSDPRISLKEYEVWKSLSDFKRFDASLVEAAEAAKRRGASLLLLA